MKNYLIVVVLALVILLAVAGVLRRAVNQIETIQEEQVAMIDTILD